MVAHKVTALRVGFEVVGNTLTMLAGEDDLEHAGLDDALDDRASCGSGRMQDERIAYSGLPIDRLITPAPPSLHRGRGARNDAAQARSRPFFGLSPPRTW